MARPARKIQLLPVEKGILLYLAVTFVLMLFFHSRLSGIAPHLVFRAALAGTIILLPALEDFYCQSSRIRAFRVFLPFVLLAFFYAETDYLNNLIVQQNLDPFFSRAEEAVFGCQPALLFSGLIPHNGFAELMYFGYFSYYCLSIGIPIYIYFSAGRETGERFGFMIIVSFLVFYLFFILVPVAGPQFYYSAYPDKVPGGYFFGRMIGIIQAEGEGQTAAFPSSHVTICLMLLWGAYRYAKNLLPFIIPVSILLLFSTVYLRAHYVIDVIAGVAAMPLMWYLSSAIYKKLRREAYSGLVPSTRRGDA